MTGHANWRTQFDPCRPRKEPSILFYSHDGFGLGHLTRTLFLAQKLRQQVPQADIVIVASSPAARHLRQLDDFEYIKIPAVVKTGIERYRPHRLNCSLQEVVALRSAILLTTAQRIQPDLFIVDHRPLGLKNEVLPTLEWLREHVPSARTVAGLRDIIDDPRTVVAEWTKHGIYHALDLLYDAVLVYGESSVADPRVEYEMPASVSGKVHFTGYLGRGVPRLARKTVRGGLGINQERLVVVHAGGGGDGAHLIDTYLQSTPLLPRDVHSLVVTGPLMDRPSLDRLRGDVPSGVTLVEYQDDLASTIAAADLSVSMGGYNTICEVLSAGVPALVVPRFFPRREQCIRAQKLATRGLLDVLMPASLSPETLAEHVISGLESCHHDPDGIALDGGTRATQIFLSLLEDAQQEGPAYALEASIRDNSQYRRELR